MSDKPPEWAEIVLGFILPGDHRDSVTGDLLEEYRERILPERGEAGADLWYVRQVLGFVWRATWIWGALLAAGVFIREVFDLFDPPRSYYARSVISTYAAIGTFAIAGFIGGRRAQSFRGGRSRVDNFGDAVVAGALNGFAGGLIAAVLEMLGVTAMLALWHDPQSLDAIARSGGLDEAFFLPLAYLVPGTIFATLGGVVGMVSKVTNRLDVV